MARPTAALIVGDDLSAVGKSIPGAQTFNHFVPIDDIVDSFLLPIQDQRLSGSAIEMSNVRMGRIIHRHPHVEGDIAKKNKL